MCIHNLDLKTLQVFHYYFIIRLKHSSKHSTSLKYSTSIFSLFLHYSPSLLPHRTINDLFIFSYCFISKNQKTVKHNENKIKFKPIIHIFIRTQSKAIQSYFNLTIHFFYCNSSCFTICRAYYEIR